MSDTRSFATLFYDLAAKGDVEQLRTLYAEDARIWHNTDQISQSVDENLQGIAMFAKSIEQMHFAIEAFDELPDGFIQQHVVRGILPNGQSIAIHACNVARIAHGKITELREYIDTAQLAPLFQQ